MIDQHSSLSEKFLKKGFWLYLFSFIIAPIGYIIKIIISGELSVSEVGILYGIISLITLLGSFNDLGLSESLKFFIPKYVEKKQYDKVKMLLFISLLVQIFTSLIISGGLYYFSDVLAEKYFKSTEVIQVIKYFAFFFIAYNILQTLNQFFLAIQNTLYSKISDFLRTLFLLFFVLAVFILDIGSLQNYSIGWVFGIYIGLVITIIIFYTRYYQEYLSEHKFSIDKNLCKEFFVYALYTFLGYSVASLLHQMDMQMIIILLGATDAGYYTNYLSIIGIPVLFLGPILFLLYPIFSQLYEKKELGTIKNIKNIFFQNFVILGFFLSTFFFIFSEVVTVFLFGEKYIYSGEILRYSIFFLSFTFLLRINYNVLSGTGRTKEKTKIIFIALLFNFFLNIYFIKILGAKGAALSTALSWFLIFILTEIYIGKNYRMQFNIKVLTSNVLLFLGLSFISKQYFLHIVEDTSGIRTFIYLCFIFAFWCTSLIVVNYNTFQKCITSLKKIKNK